METNDTSELLANARAGDLAAQQQLLVQYRQRLRRMVVAYLDPQLVSRLDPSDVVQDALTRAAVRLPQYLQDPPLAFYPWLRRIVREQLIIVHRRHVEADCRSVRRERPLGFDFPDESAMQLADHLVAHESSPSQQIGRREMQNRVRMGLKQLEPRDRELMLMRFVEQLKINEIAEVLGIAESTVKSRIARVLEKLTRLMKSYE